VRAVKCTIRKLWGAKFFPTPKRAIFRPDEAAKKLPDTPGKFLAETTSFIFSDLI
jgi:hypothetical protein